MIENRHRIENEVLLGRQAIRRVLQSKDKAREAAKPQSSQLPQSATGTRLPQDGTDTGPVPTTSEAPMSMDTDAEDAFKRGSRWFFKRDTNKSGSLTPRDKEAESRETGRASGVPSQPLTWSSGWPSFFHSQRTNNLPTVPQQNVAEPIQQPDEIVLQDVIPPSSPSLLNRIRRRSILSSPFSTLRHTAARVASRPGSEYGGDGQGTWSSDTSSDEDLPSPEWRGSKLPQFSSLVNFEDVDDIPILSSPDEEADENDQANPEVEVEGAEQDS